MTRPSPSPSRSVARRRLLALLPALMALPAAADEVQLRRQLQQAVWPPELVEAADRYLAAHPTGPAAAEARSLRQEAGRGVDALARADVRLFRNAFVSDDPRLRPELRRAALGDAAAASALARRYREGDGVGADLNRSLGWLQYAAMLGDVQASYALALHYRRDANPTLAAKYEALAVERGFQPPRDLDHVRK